MRKPKLNVGQDCFFIVIWNDEGSEAAPSFTVNSGNVRAIEYDSETDEYAYHVASPFVFDFVPDWMKKFLPKKFWICRVVRSIYHHFNREYVHVLQDIDVYHDVRDAMKYGQDFVTMIESANGEA